MRQRPRSARCSSARPRTATLHVNNAFAVTGGGILNGSANVQVFFINSALNFSGGTITGAVEFYNSGALSFANASAGSANILNFTNATIEVNAGGTAGNATIFEPQQRHDKTSTPAALPAMPTISN